MSATLSTSKSTTPIITSKIISISIARITSVKASIGIFTHQGHISKVGHSNDSVGGVTHSHESHMASIALREIFCDALPFLVDLVNQRHQDSQGHRGEKSH